MRQNIVNLTGHLISKNRYDDSLHRIGNPDEFVQHVKIDLDAGDVRTMSPAKLGEIMCSFEVGDVMAGQTEIFNNIHFSGDCAELLRELVSLCLAYAIRDRLGDGRYPGIPRWLDRSLGSSRP